MCVISNFGAIFIGLSFFVSVTFGVAYYVESVRFIKNVERNKENDIWTIIAAWTNDSAAQYGGC